MKHPYLHQKKKELALKSEDYLRTYKRKTALRFWSIFLIFFIGFSILAITTFAQDKSNLPVDVSGYIVDTENDKVKDVEIVIYEGNNPVKNIEAKRGKFDFELHPGVYYTIEMKKEGFLPKRIGIDTYIPPKTYVVEPFRFVMEMIREKETEDDFVLDFPVALVKFYKGKGRFDFITKYTKAIRAEQQMALKD